MSSRRAIFDRLLSRQVDPVDLPEHEGPWIRYDDPVAQFQTMVQFVGGACTRCGDWNAATERVRAIQAELKPNRIVSTLPRCIEGTVQLDSIPDPHDLENVDWVVSQAAIGVAENGALWLDDRQLKHRVIYFITQHLLLVVRKSDIVHHMHEAYAKLPTGSAGFGMFLSGPSKTADIEQSLVLGAHGSRSLQVIVVEE